jgi:hypothetical protein
MCLSQVSCRLSLKILFATNILAYFTIQFPRESCMGQKNLAYFAKLSIAQKDWMCRSQVSSRLSKKILFGTNGLAYFTIPLLRESQKVQTR